MTILTDRNWCDDAFWTAAVGLGVRVVQSPIRSRPAYRPFLLLESAGESGHRVPKPGFNLDEIEQAIVRWIVDVYHNTPQPVLEGAPRQGLAAALRQLGSGSARFSRSYTKLTLPSEHHQMIDALAAKDIEELKRVMHVRHAVWDLFIDTKLQRHRSCKRSEYHQLKYN